MMLLLLQATLLLTLFSAQEHKRGFADFFEAAAKVTLEENYGKDAIDLLGRADKFTVYRVEPGAGTAKTFEMLKSPVQPAADWIRTFKRIMDDKKSHMGVIGMFMFCAFSPGVVVRTRHDRDEINVVFCFSCDQLWLAKDGKYLGRPSSILPSRAAFLKLFRELYPDDAVIQGLKDKRGPHSHLSLTTSRSGDE